MTLPDVSGSLGPLSPGTNGTLWAVGPRVVRYQIPALAYLTPGTLWAVGPRVVRYQIPALAYLTPGALWTLRTRGTSLTSGPIGTRDSIRTLHAVHYDVWTLGPLGPLGPTSPRGPSARPCRLQTDSLHSTDARCYRCKMLQMQDAKKTCLLFPSRVYWNHPIS
ncbi:ORF35 [Frog virus 3]|nr:ORF35 [Frog virus 3]WAS06879.1 ORF35 [Frog virus 3]